MEAPNEKESDRLQARRSSANSHLAMAGTKASLLESLDYEINESDLLKQDESLQCVFLKWALAFLVGFITGAIASFINFSIENIAGRKMLVVARFVEAGRYLNGFLCFAGMNLGLTATAAFLCVMVAPTAAGPGIPEIKAYLNGVDTPNFFGASTLFVKHRLELQIIGSIGAVSAGLDLGKEGPLVHIGACIASLLSGNPRREWLRQLSNDRDRRDLITCGASSGVCAAFRSPVGGVLFATEEVATWLRSPLLWRTFFSTAVVLVVLRAFFELCASGHCSLFGKGSLILFDLRSVPVHYGTKDILPVSVVGILGGLLGSLYNLSLAKVLGLYALINEKGRAAKLVLTLSVALLTSACLYLLPFLAPCSPCATIESGCGNLKQFNCPSGHYNDLASLLHTTNDNAVRSIFSAPTLGTASLAFFFGLYCVLGVLTFGIAVPSGLFLPIILMGSAYGRLIGILAEPIGARIDQRLYAVLGSAALMAGSMRMTVSVCLIFLELTDNLLLLPVTMIVLLIAKAVGDALVPSIYDIILDLKGLPFLYQNPEPWMRELTVGELARRSSLVCFRAKERLSRLVRVLRTTAHNGFPVIDDNGGKLHGLVLRARVVDALRREGLDLEEEEEEEEKEEMEIDLRPYANSTPFTVVETMSAAKAAVLFRNCALRHLLVVPKHQGERISPVVGILTRKDLRAQNLLAAFPQYARKIDSSNHY